MSRDYKVYLDDILSSVANIMEYTDGFSKDNFFLEKMAQDAVIRNLEIIGEAVKKLPEDFRASHQDIDWKRIAGLRDILIHEYFGINLEIVWDIVENKIPVLKDQISKLL